MEEGPAAALEARRLLQRGQRLLSAIVRGLLAGAVLTLAIMASSQPEISKGCLLRNGYSAVLTGVTNSILADVLNGRLNVVLVCVLQIGIHC